MLTAGRQRGEPPDAGARAGLAPHRGAGVPSRRRHRRPGRGPPAGPGQPRAPPPAGRGWRKWASSSWSASASPAWSAAFTPERRTVTLSAEATSNLRPPTSPRTALSAHASRCGSSTLERPCLSPAESSSPTRGPRGRGRRARGDAGCHYVGAVRGTYSSGQPGHAKPWSPSRAARERSRLCVVHENCDVHPVRDPELGEKARDVRFDGGLAHEQRCGNLGVGCTGPHRSRHLTLPLGE